MTVKIPTHIRDLVPYRAGRSPDGRDSSTRFAKLSSNENPLGPSPLALQAMEREAVRSHVYPDPTAKILREALSRSLGVSADRIVCANGSDAILEYAIMSFSEGNDEILTSEGTFIGLYVIAKKLGRTLRTVPLKDWGYDLDAIEAAIHERTKVIYLANPNNPTGTHVQAERLRKFLAAVPDRILIILDEAYAEYALASPDYLDGAQCDQENLLLLRTFSKVHGLAGLRVGFGITTPSLAEALSKVKLPFEPSRIAQTAATAAISDRDHLDAILSLNLEAKKLFRACFTSLKLEFVESLANFFMIAFDTGEEAADFTDACAKRGLYVRHLPGFGIPRAVRINTGTLEETTFAVDVIASVIQEKGVHA